MNRIYYGDLERATGIEPATPSLGIQSNRLLVATVHECFGKRNCMLVASC